MRRIASVAVALAVVAGVVSFGSPASAGDREPQGRFSTSCRFTHRAPDDPIVRPNEAGGSHNHDFFGNFSTDATSTYESLRAAGGMCSRPGDTAAYWVPTLLQNGRAVTPRGSSIYYLSARKPAASIKPHPAGLKLIAGDAKATAPQSRHVTAWGCTGDTDVRPSSSVPTCPDGSNLKLIVRFPDCWNGRDLDSPDHKSHMAYSSRGACPDGYPVAVPLVQMNVRYPIRGGGGITLSSGSSATAHADFFNAWDQTVLAALVRDCLNARVVCHSK